MRPWQAAIAVTAVLAATPSRLAAQPPPPSFTMRLVLPDADLTPGQAAALKSEVATIWSPLGLQIVWPRGRRVRDQAAADWTVGIDLRDRVPLAAQSAPQPLGAVAVIDGRMRRTIYVSRGKVGQFVDAAGIRAFDGLYDRLYQPLPRPHRRPRARASAARLGTPPRPRPDAPAVRRARRPQRRSRPLRIRRRRSDRTARALRGAAARAKPVA